MQRNINYYLYSVAAGLTVIFPVILLAGHVATDITLSAIATLFLVRCCLEKNWQWARQPWVQCVAVLWLYSVARSLFAEHPDDALRRTLPFVRYFIFAAALACWTLCDSVNRTRFLHVLTATVIFLALDGLLQWSTGSDLLRHGIILQPGGNLRLTGAFHAPILGIMLAWLCFPVILPLFMPSPNAPSVARTLCATAVALLVFALIALSGERMAMLFMLGGLGLALCLIPSVRRSILLILLACIALFALLAHSDTMLKERQVNSTLSTLEHFSQSPYGLLLSSDLKIAGAHPFFGIGANHFRYFCPPLYAATPDIIPMACNTHPHNIYMEWLLEEGVIGFGIFIAFLVAVCRQLLNVWPGMRAQGFFIGLLIALSFRLWPFAPSTNFFSPWGAPPFWLVLGALLAYTMPPKELSSCASS